MFSTKRLHAFYFDLGLNVSEISADSETFQRLDRTVSWRMCLESFCAVLFRVSTDFKWNSEQAGWCKASPRRWVSLCSKLGNSLHTHTHTQQTHLTTPEHTLPPFILSFFALFCVFLHSPAPNAWLKPYVWLVIFLCPQKKSRCHFRAGHTLVCYDSWQQSGLVGKVAQTASVYMYMLEWM